MSLFRHRVLQPSNAIPPRTARHYTTIRVSAQIHYRPYSYSDAVFHFTGFCFRRYFIRGFDTCSLNCGFITSIRFLRHGLCTFPAFFMFIRQTVVCCSKSNDVLCPKTFWQMTARNWLTLYSKEFPVAVEAAFLYIIWCYVYVLPMFVQQQL